MSMSRPVSSWGAQEPKHTPIPLPSQFNGEHEFGDLPISLKLFRHHIIAARDNAVLVYSLPDCRLLHSLEEADDVDDFVVFRDTLALALSNGIVRVYDLATGECIHNMHFPLDDRDSSKYLCLIKPESINVEHNGSVTQEKLQQRALIVGWQDFSFATSFRVWRLPHRGEQGLEPTNDSIENDPFFMHDLGALNHPIVCLATRGETVLTGSRDQTVRIWNVTTGECLKVLIGHRARVDIVDLDEEQAYSSSYDGTVRIWNLATGDCLHILQYQVFFGDTRYPKTLSLSSFHFRIHIYNDEGELYIWDTKTRKLLNKLDHFASRGYQIDERKIVARKGRNLDILDIQSGRLLKRLSFGPENYEDIIFRTSEPVFRGRFCAILIPTGRERSISVWEFADEDGWEEDDEDA